MSYTLISGEPAEEYERFLLECFENLKDWQVKGLALVAMVRDPERDEDSAVTGYWHMGSMSRSYAAAHLQADAIDAMILDNIKRYQDYDPEDDTDPEED